VIVGEAVAIDGDIRGCRVRSGNLDLGLLLHALIGGGLHLSSWRHRPGYVDQAIVGTDPDDLRSRAAKGLIV